MPASVPESPAVFATIQIANSKKKPHKTKPKTQQQKTKTNTKTQKHDHWREKPNQNLHTFEVTTISKSKFSKVLTKFSNTFMQSCRRTRSWICLFYWALRNTFLVCTMLHLWQINRTFSYSMKKVMIWEYRNHVMVGKLHEY